MTTDPAARLEVLCRQLTENIMGAALCAKELASLVRELHDLTPARANGQAVRSRGTVGRPILDEATLSVVWNGRALHLGHTQGFWLLARLARSANQYVTHLDLIQEIWDDDFTDTTVLRAGVRRLRIKLRRGGMGDLADAIVGHHGRYMLSLNGSESHTEVTTTSP
ncbi:MAG: winged helix-turn-helix transcriptional regulator [Phycisphaerales bacterium]|nr:winged helix-turn-helix transcriptional regulator [Phycisphaerales bacterium]